MYKGYFYTMRYQYDKQYLHNLNHVEFVYNHMSIIVIDTSKIGISILVGGFNPSEKYEFVNWVIIPNIRKVIKIHVPNQQPVINHKPLYNHH